jgi:hypothetical protein
MTTAHASQAELLVTESQGVEQARFVTTAAGTLHATSAGGVDVAAGLRLTPS